MKLSLVLALSASLACLPVPAHGCGDMSGCDSTGYQNQWQGNRQQLSPYYGTYGNGGPQDYRYPYQGKPAPNIPHSGRPSLQSASKVGGAATQIYHCPMHPEIVSDSPGTCPKCGMNLALKGPGVQHMSGCGDMPGCENGSMGYQTGKTVQP